MFKNKKVFILGMGKSGVSVAKLLAKDNQVLITDVKNDNLKEIEELQTLGVNVTITKDQLELFDDSFDYVVKNPGVKLDHPIVLKAEELKIPVITELEVAYNYLPDVKIVGITGSNGKTTTTTITYEFLKAAGLPVHLAGNIGYPLCDQINDIKKGDILVIEISSHQLANLDKFRVNIGVLTNLYQVHLDHFKTYDNYKKTKMKIFNNQTSDDVAILNKGDQEVYELTKNLKAQKLYFSSRVNADICIKDDALVYNGEKVALISDIRVKGMHNYENIMAAILVAKQFDISNNIIKEVLDNFAGVEHRIEFVKKVNGREFYNDSKATNVDSTITALKSFNNDVVLILGGLDRGHSFEGLTDYLNHTTHIVCYGQTKLRIKDFAIKNNIDVIVTDNLLEATKAAYNISKKGDTILLSPACASWDQYKCFEDRGNEFKQIVENL
jgi:UDP-N-acetylmuramoylalanine--D-glutamate ligase